MTESCAKLDCEEKKLYMNETIAIDDVVQDRSVRMSLKTEHSPTPKQNEGEIPPKKRKTRRGKSKRRQQNVKNSKYKRRQQYVKNSRKSNKLIKPEAPHNSNQFLLEDHGLIEGLDENLKAIDQVSTSTPGRTRDSSLSVDSDGEFYSSPDDEEQFLIKDFDDQYESLHAERLQAMTKTELIQEYIILENKLELISKRVQKDVDNDEESEHVILQLKREIERLIIENDRLQRENDFLRDKLNVSDSEDSETDSTDSCTSSSSNSASGSSSNSSSPRSDSVSTVDYSQSNGHISTSSASVGPV